MTWDAKDKALLSASSLVGYCQSVLSLYIDCADHEAERLNRWTEGLIKYANECGAAIDKAFKEDEQ